MSRTTQQPRPRAWSCHNLWPAFRLTHRSLRIWTPRYQVVILRKFLDFPIRFPSEQTIDGRYIALFGVKSKPDPFRGYRVVFTWLRIALLRLER